MSKKHSSDSDNPRPKSPEKKLRFEDEEPPIPSEPVESVVDRQLRELNEERRRHFSK